MNVTQSSFNKILKENFLFEKEPSIAVAVSGGPDSMALLFLLNNWIKKRNGYLIALIVNHQIRENSELEARKISNYLKKNKIKSRIFNVNEKKVIKKNMNEARKNRFNRLVNFCSQNNIFRLFLAHHYDDNIETFLLRKIAGSNIEGLHGMQLKFNYKSIQLLRPFLTFTKLSIIAYNKKNKIYFINDPSNDDLKYSRVAVRKFLKENTKYKKQAEKDFNFVQGYHPKYIRMINEFFNRACLKIEKKKIVIINSNFLKKDIDIQSKIIEIIYRFLMPNKEFLRYKKIINLLTFIDNKTGIKANLGGISVKKDVFYTSFFT